MISATLSGTNELPSQAGQLMDNLRLMAPGLRQRFGPLAVIIAIHLAVFYLLYSGALGRVAHFAEPSAVVVKFVLPALTPPPPVTTAMPKTAVLTPPAMLPAAPQINIAPLENAITTPPPPVAAVLERAPAPVAVAVASNVTAAPAAGPKTVSSGIEYIQEPRPVYPAMSKRLGEQGKVTLLVLVNEKGRAETVTVQNSSGSPRLDDAGRFAAQRAVFKPHVEGGRPVAMFAIVTLAFELPT